MERKGGEQPRRSVDRVRRLVENVLSRHVLAAALAVTALCSTLVASARVPEPPADPAQRLRLAEGYLWLGIAADGDPLSLAKARAMIASLPADLAQGADARALEAAIAVQKDMADETLNGRFPLARLLAGEAPKVRYEWSEPPEVAASNVAVRRLLEEAGLGHRNRGHLMVVVSAPEHYQRIEGEALSLATSVSGVVPVTRRMVAGALGNDAALLAQMDGPNPGAAARRKLLTALGGSTNMLYLWLKPTVLDGGDYMVEAQGQVFTAESDKPLQSYATRGFGFDRRGQVVPVGLAHAGLGLLAVVLVLALLRRPAAASQPLSHDLALAVAAFAVGRLAPLGIFRFVAAAVPAPAADAQLGVSFWWPGLVGVVVFVLPIVAWRLALARFATHVPALTSSGRLGVVGMALGMGAAAHGASALALYLEGGAWLPVAALTVAAGAIGFGFGRSLDRLDPLSVLWGVPCLVLALALGWALSAAQLPAIAAIAVLAVAVLAASALARRPAGEAAAEIDGEVEAPADWHMPELEQLRDRARAFAPGQVVWLGVAGEEGTGKSVLIADFLADLKAAHPGLLVLRGRCVPMLDTGAAPPFGPIQQALSAQLSISLGQEGMGAAIGSAIDDAAALLMGPMAGFLRGEGGVASEADIFAFITRKLHDLALSRPLVLSIDDCQWLDESSAGLLAYLRRSLRGQDGGGIAIVLAGRDDPGHGIDAVRLDPLGPARQREFLVAALGLAEPAAQWLLHWLGGAAHGQPVGALARAVEHFRRHGLLEEDRDGILSLRPNLRPEDVPLLAGARERLRGALDAMPECRLALTAAACAGLRFDAAHLAEAVERPLGDTVLLLDEFARRTGMLADDGETFTFTSVQLLEAARAELQVSGAPTQLVRHLHGRLAEVLKVRGVFSAEDRLRVALHYLAAGRAFAAPAVAACIDAAGALARMFRYDEARQMLARASDVARQPGDHRAVARAAWQVDAAEAHVSGIADHAARVARQGLALLAADPAATELLPRVAQACYDGVRADRALLDETARLARTMAECEGETAAEGLHLMALASPLDQRDHRRALLRRALATAEEGGADTAWARIANSLAEELSQNPADPAEAHRLFTLSLDIKNRDEIRDLPGLARTHGGLGRLAYFSSPPDLDAARFHFHEDLTLSEQIGDRRGVSKMHSMLGAVARDQGLLGEAEAHFRRSIAEEVDQLDICMSLAGLLDCLRRGGDVEAWQAAAAEAQGRAPGFAVLPAFARDALERALAQPAEAS